MKHLRTDYDAIQPWPTKRPHIAKSRISGETITMDGQDDGYMLDPIIPDDEPVFLLRAKDAFAPVLVRLWASMLFLSIDQRGEQLSDLEDEAASQLAARVNEWADEMAEYAEMHGGGKTPDTPWEMLK